MGVVTSLRQHVNNARGWRTKRRIVVFESDDWGAIRTASKQALLSLEQGGIRVKDCHYMRYDALASEQDLSFLFEVLRQFQGKDGVRPVITANAIMANPDFDKIEKSDFQSYHWEHFTESLRKYGAHQNAFGLWQEGIANALFWPQFHGREHLHISRWMNDLKNGNKEALLGFKLGMFGISGHILSYKRGSYLAAFDKVEGDSPDNRADVINQGLQIFKDTFGFSAQSCIAPNYVWDDIVERAMDEMGVRYIQGTNTQRISRKYGDELTTRYHLMGEKNAKGQLYLTRNAYFEPSSNPNKDWVDSCLKSIANAFFWNNPAIVATHRVNFIGYIEPKNRDKNLALLSNLLRQIVKRWPDVEFMTSDQLGGIMDKP